MVTKCGFARSSAGGGAGCHRASSSLMRRNPGRSDRADQRPTPVKQWHSWYHFGIVGVMAMTLRTDEELDAALSELAAAEGISKQDVIRRAVLERHARAGHQARVTESGGRLAAQWRDVLDRLGSA